MTSAIRELALITSLTRTFTRSPRQMNRLHESDAELLRLPSGDLLAITTDAISEELSSGLYRDPFLAGWMVVMANMSDLAAVGAEPLGILLAQTLPPSLSGTELERLQEGIRGACSACGTYVLGGDTNEGPALHLTGTGVGVLSGDHPLSRIGCREHDVLCATGPLGGGNAFAANQFARSEVASTGYAPAARIRQGMALRSLASACMDTSDGLFATLDQLSRLNAVGFDLDDDWADGLDVAAHDACADLDIPLWAFLAAPHGEFELVFSISLERLPVCKELFGSYGWRLLQLGRVRASSGIHVPGIGTFTPPLLAAIRNASPLGRGGLTAYLQLLQRIGRLAERFDSFVTSP